MVARQHGDHAVSLYSRPLKARKAKYGWDLGSLHLGMVVDLGKFIQELETMCPGEYTLEQVGMHKTDIRLYTDNDAWAAWIQGYLTESNNHA